MSDEERCEAGEIWEQRCDNAGSDVCYTVRYVPQYLRGTAEAAGTARGFWTTLNICHQCADAIRDLCEQDPVWDEWYRVE